jgi:hypothetical protein
MSTCLFSYSNMDSGTYLLFLPGSYQYEYVCHIKTELVIFSPLHLAERHRPQTRGWLLSTLS